MALNDPLDTLQLTDYDTQFDDVENYDYGKWPILKNRVARLLYFSAGADVQLLQACPHSDRVKEQCIGMMVLATATLAFFSGSYAFYTVFSPKDFNAVDMLSAPIHWPSVLLSVLFGLFWSLMIFNLDRFIVSSTGHGDGTDKITLGEFARALPRIFMALMIGIVLSKPLEIRIMANEISVQLFQDSVEWVNKEQIKSQANLDKNIALKQADKDEINKRIDKIEAENAAADKRVDDVTNAAGKEAEGSGGTNHRGLGKVYEVRAADKERAIKEREALAEKNKIELASLKEQLKGVDSELTKYRNLANQLHDDLVKQSYRQNGLWSQIKAAMTISEVASWSLTLLLVILEIAPIILKMMLTLTPYEYLQENTRLKAMALRGIDLQQELMAKKENIELSDSKYFEVDVLKEIQIGKLRIEEQLTKVAQESFLQRIKEDIEKNPSKYIRDRAVNEAEKNNQTDLAKKQSDLSGDSEAVGDGANKTAGA